MTRRSDKPDRPSRNKPQTRSPADADDLPTLPSLDPVDDLPVLEPVDDASAEPDFPVKVECQSSDEAGFDTAIAIEVPELDKKEMADAVAKPLQHSLDSGRAKVRHHRVLVRFSGDAIIGSAVKERCGQILQAAKARKVVVRRGYGDEVLFEHEAPRAQLTQRVEGGVLVVDVDTGELEAVDLSVALQGALLQLSREARDQKVQLAFRGKSKPDQGLRDLIGQVLREGGALRAALGQRVLFDKELEDRVQLQVLGEQAHLRIDPAPSDADTEEALAMQLAALGERVRGKVVRIAFAKPESEAVRGATLRYCTAGAPQRIEVVRGAAVEVVWPPLLTVDGGGGETLLKVVSNGRDRSAVMASFAQEVRDFTPVIARKRVLVELPPGTVVDADFEARCLQGLVELGASAVTWTAGGERERFHPPVVSDSVEGGAQVVAVDTEAGKPAELQRAFERWLASKAGGLRGQSVRLAFRGQGAVSRTLARGLTDALAKVQPSRLEVAKDGVADVVVPALLSVRSAGEGAHELAVAGGGRDAAQVELALARELDALPGLDSSRVRIAAGAHESAVVAALVARRVGAVELAGDAPVQVHPALLAFERGKRGARLTAQAGVEPAMAARMAERELAQLLPAADSLASTEVAVTGVGIDAGAEPAATVVRLLVERGAAKVRLDDGAGNVVQAHPIVPREFVTVLGRKDDANPPLVMLGIGLQGGSDQQERVLVDLQGRADLLVGRRVLLVGRRDGADVPFPAQDAVADAVRAFVDGAAAATLVFAGNDGRGRPYFKVAHSSVEGLAQGACFGDPRQRPA